MPSLHVTLLSVGVGNWTLDGFLVLSVLFFGSAELDFEYVKNISFFFPCKMQNFYQVTQVKRISTLLHHEAYQLNLLPHHPPHRASDSHFSTSPLNMNCHSGVSRY